MQNLITGITERGNVDIAKVDKFGVGLELKKFKNKNNSINYSALFAIPKEQRIAAMAEKDLGATIKLITVAITLALETMNVKRGMNALQILDLAEAVVDEAESDQLSIEDFMLFLQKLTRGEYLDLFEGIDQAKIMQRFGEYRDERWNAGIELRDAKTEEYKRLGDDNSFERTTGRDADTLDLQLKHWKQKTMEKKDEKIESKRYK